MNIFRSWVATKHWKFLSWKTQWLSVLQTDVRFFIQDTMPRIIPKMMCRLWAIATQMAWAVGVRDNREMAVALCVAAGNTFRATSRDFHGNISFALTFGLHSLGFDWENFCVPRRNCQSWLWVVLSWEKWNKHFPVCFHIPVPMQRCHRHFTGMGGPGPRVRPADFLLGSKRQ